MLFLRFTVLLGLFLVIPAQGELRFAEVMTCNTKTYADSQGEFPDWIELCWQGKESVNLEAFQIGRKGEALSPMPSLTLDPGSRVVLFASGRESWEAGGYHLPFRLGAKGVALVLAGPNAHEVKIPTLPADVSYGVEEGSMLSEPTPGDANAEPIGAPPAPPLFSVERGFYSSAFALSMEGPVDSEIRYTLDGSAPSAIHGMVYQRPLEIEETSVVRAVCVLPEHLPSRVTTASYLFPNDILTPTTSIPNGWPSALRINRQRLVYGMEAPMNIGATHDEMAKGLLSLPSISLVMDLDDLLDAENGIYTHAVERGRAWERSVSMEWIDPQDDSRCHQSDGGLRIRGGYSRHRRVPKHGLRVIARSAYGAEAFDWPCFGEAGPNKCQTVDLRSPQNHSWSTDGSVDNTFLRDGFCRDTQRDLGQPYTRGQFVHLFLNGVYWGVFETHERVDAEYAARYLGADPETVDVIKAAHPGVLDTVTAAREGDLEAWRHLWENANRLAAQRDESMRLALYRELQGLTPEGKADPDKSAYVEVASLIDYMMIILFSANQDAPISQFFGNVHPNNWFAVRDREGMEGFRFFIHDSEHSLGLPRRFGNDRTGPYPGGASFEDSNPQWLHQQLMSVKAYREAFGDRAEAVLGRGGILSPSASLARLAEREKWLEPVMALHAARWGHAQGKSRTKDDWLGAVARLKTYLIERPDVVKGQLRAAKRFAFGDPSQHFVMAPLSPWVDAPQVWPALQDPSLVRLTAEEGEIIYTLDGEKEAQAIPGEMKRVVLVKEDFPWMEQMPRKPDLSYQDASRQQGAVEIRVPFELESLQTLADLELQFTFDDDYVVSLNGHELARFEAGRRRLSDERAVPVIMDLKAEVSHLREGANVLGFRFVRSPEAFAPRLEATFVMGGKAIPVRPGQALKARVQAGKSKSALALYQPIGPAERASAANVLISEIMYHPPAVSRAEQRRGVKDPDTFEFLEFLNIGSKPVSFTKVRFIDGIKFQFPDREPALLPAERLVVAKNPKAFALRYPKVKRVLGPYAGGLKNGGERLTVLDSHSQPIVRFRYDDKAPWPSSADGLGFSLVLASTVGKSNFNKASSWRASSEVHGSPGRSEPNSSFAGIVVNEVLTNTDWPQTDAIELHNPSERSVNVSGWFLTDDVKEPKKWAIPANTVIPAKGFWVVYEDNDADPDNNADLGPSYFGSAFSLSSFGEEAFLFSANARGELTGYTHGCEFDAMPAGIAYGRSINSAGKDVFAIRKPTLGQPNGVPLLGPVLFTEVFYHPDESDPDEASEFIEIWNHTDQDIPLFDPERPEHTWALKGAKFAFPEGQTLAANEAALIVRMPPEAFRKKRGLPVSMKIYGPFEGGLNNSGERLTLLRPQAPELDGEEVVVPMVPVDSIRYNDKAPWPETADGTGKSLERREVSGITDEPQTWGASAETGGTPGGVSLKTTSINTNKEQSR